MSVISGDVPGQVANRASESAEPPDPVARLRQLIEDRREESVEILRSWMEDNEEKA